MQSNVPIVKLGEVLTHRGESIKVDDLKTYTRVTARLHAKGIIYRDEIEGSRLKTKKQRVCKSGDFLVAEIDAKLGGFGIVPPPLEGSIVSPHYFLFDIDQKKLVTEYLDSFIKTEDFQKQITARGSTNYAAVRPPDILQLNIPLPPIKKQQEIAQYLSRIYSRLKQIKQIKQEYEILSKIMLDNVFLKLVRNQNLKKMKEIAPYIRRKVNIDIDQEYPELGIRSFGNGTFHKPSLAGGEIVKKMFRIEPGDLIFNNVFAWEGAIAVAKDCDSGRFGSHRFITCLPKKGIVTAEFLKFYFLTDEGLKKIGDASPGGALRNRTLSLKSLQECEVPLPSFEKQLWFNCLQSKVDEVKRLQADTEKEIEALFPAVLVRVFGVENKN